MKELVRLKLLLDHGLTSLRQEFIFQAIMQFPTITSMELAETLNISSDAVRNNIKILVKNQLITIKHLACKTGGKFCRFNTTPKAVELYKKLTHHD